jgi:pilus assembly protein Flp/PilA
MPTPVPTPVPTTQPDDVSDADERGQGLAEYALILALIAIVAIVALIFLGSQVSTILSKVGGSI